VVVVDLPGLGDKAGDLDLRELREALASPATLIVMEFLTPLPSAKTATWKIGMPFSSVHCALVAKTRTGSDGPAAANLIAEVSMGSRMMTPSGGKAYAFH